jgi:DNA invertase Pin-like site-specific DNA recombinase
MKNQAVAYLRVSSKGQTNGDGFERQEDVINRYASKHQIEIKAIYQENVSGTSSETDRPAFQEMVSDLLKNGCRTVIIERLDRLAREYRIQETLLIYLASKGLSLISAATEENVTEAIQEDPMKKALVQMQGVFAELEKNLLVKKLRVARQRKKAVTGKCEGRKSYSERAPEVLAEVKRLRRKRKGIDRRTSFSQIAEILNDKGFRNSTGNLFNGKTVSSLYHRNK